MERGERLKRALADRYKAQELPGPSEEELATSAASLTRFFELLVEADRKANQPHASQHLRNPNRSSPA